MSQDSAGSNRPTSGRPSFSVVIAAYNASSTLGRTIESVRTQTLHDWELVVVDDGSADETSAIAMSVAAADPRVRAIRQGNAGTAAARNAGAALATGSILAFLDADDRMTPDYLETVRGVAQQHPECVAFSPRAAWHYEDGSTRIQPSEHEFERPVSLLGQIAQPMVPVYSAVRAEAFEALGGFRDVYAEDYDLWLRLLAAGGSVCRVSKVLVDYDARTSGKSADRVRQTESVMGSLTELAAQRADDPPIGRAIERRLVELRRDVVLAPVKARIRCGDYDGARAAFWAQRHSANDTRALLATALVMLSPRLYRRFVLAADPNA